MPKPWEYTPRRHLLMQVIMWLVLCGTLGVAYAVSRTLGAPTGAEVNLGPVSLRLPDGFRLDDNPEADLQAHDSNKRVLLVQIVPDLLDDGELSNTLRPFDFRGLQQTGRLSILKRTLPRADGASAQLTFTASARMPTLHQRIVLNLIAVEEAESEQNADRAVLQKVANSVTVTGGPPTPRQRDHSKDTVVLQSIKSRGAKI
jgi:hypothetical protein